MPVAAATTAPAAGNAVSVRSNRCAQCSDPGQKATANCAAMTATLAMAPAEAEAHQGQWRTPGVWILQWVAAPAQSRRQPQRNTRAQKLMKKLVKAAER